MSWEIVTKEEAVSFCRVNISFLQDYWYNLALGSIENFTGWRSLTTEQDFDGYMDGTGTAILRPQYYPINSLTTLEIEGVAVPTSSLWVAWNSFQLRTYKPGQTFSNAVYYDTYGILKDVFPYGIKNIRAVYNYGGIDSLPQEYQDNLRLTLLMIIKEVSVIPRNEGSDYVIDKYRPDRTLNPEEVLVTYGIHGKIKGILRAQMPKRKIYN